MVKVDKSQVGLGSWKLLFLNSISKGKLGSASFGLLHQLDFRNVFNASSSLSFHDNNGTPALRQFSRMLQAAPERCQQRGRA